jgi:multisubunit Na+/H+ antiporter MnhB subunit
MEWKASLAVTVILLLIAWYELPKLPADQKIDKYAFFFVSGMAWILAVLLVFYPNVPGPTEWVQEVYKPLDNVLDQE